MRAIKIMEMKTVSVIHSIYGNFDRKRLELSIFYASRQKAVEIELIVSEQNTSSQLQELCQKHDIKLVYSRPELRCGVPFFSPGLIRNHALIEATSEYIYTNDSDIIFPDPYYLCNLVKYSERVGKSVYWPPMMRIDIHSFDAFYEANVNYDSDYALALLTKLNNYVLGIGQPPFDVNVSYKDGEKLVIGEENYRMYKSCPEMKGMEPTIWNPVFHRGGTLAKALELRKLGGYSPHYEAWGYEDTDIHWKIREKFGIKRVPDEDKYKVYHLDHPKPYFDQFLFKNNYSKFNARKEKGIDTCIKEDLHHYLEICK